MNTLNKLELKNISHKYNDKLILNDINLNIENLSTIAIVGPSGVGKTTLFNIISGLIKPTKGKVLLDDIDITNKSGFVGYMLQKDLLLPFRTVYENISLPLEIKSYSKDKIKDMIYTYADEFLITDLLDKYPKDLSGGQRQRVALLRTYMFKTNIMLLDEPFSSLDYLTKNKMYSWFNKLKKNLDLTCLIITHDIDEAIYLSDKIYVMQDKPAKLSKAFIIPKNVDVLSNEVISIKKEILKLFSL